jgi:hypothetical protein
LSIFFFLSIRIIPKLIAVIRENIENPGIIPPLGLEGVSGVYVNVHVYRSTISLEPIINSSKTYFKTLSELNSILPEYVPVGAEKEPDKL